MASFRAWLMHFAALVILGSAGSAYAQQPPAAPAAPAQVPGQAVKPGSSVIFVTAPCEKDSPGATPATPPKMCPIMVSREDFEKLADIMVPDAAAPTRNNFGKNYGEMLGFAAEARRRGLENTAGYQEMLAWAKLNALSALLVRQVKKEAETVPDADIDAYYRDHQSDYEQLTLLRVMIPHGGSSKTQSANADEGQAYAEKIRARWIAGEDPEKLQQEAFQRAGNKAQPPAIHMEARKASIAPTQQSIFSLREGDTSAPLADPAYFYIYKIVKKEAVSLADVKAEIQRTLSSQRFREAGRKLQSEIEVKLDPDYFKAEPRPTPPGAPGQPEQHR